MRNIWIYFYVAKHKIWRVCYAVFQPFAAARQRGGIVYLAVDAIAPSAVQPRQNFPPAQLEELSRSIAEYGVLSPLTVRPRPDGYELVAGERRLRAARMAGLQ